MTPVQGEFSTELHRRDSSSDERILLGVRASGAAALKNDAKRPLTSVYLLTTEE